MDFSYILIFLSINPTVTLASSGCPYAEECIKEGKESCLNFELLNPKTNSIASRMFDFPFPLGPTIQVNF